MAVLVAGLGYIGAALAETLLERGEQVVALDNRFSTDNQAIARLVAAGVQFVSGDIAVPADVESALRQAPIETVYLFAAQSSAHPRAADAVYTERTNLRGPRVVLDALVRHECKTLVYASSFKVYGEQLSGMIDEQQPYGAFHDLAHLSKVYSEKLLEMYAGLHGMRCLALRYGIVHGLGPVCKTDPRFMTAPNKFSLQAARGEALSVYGGGRTPAGFVHVADAARAALAVADDARFTGYTPLNVVGEVASVAQVAGWIAEAGATRDLAVQIAGLDPAGPVDDTARFTVRSGLDALLFQYEHTLRESADAVLDHFIATERPVAGAIR